MITLTMRSDPSIAFQKTTFSYSDVSRLLYTCVRWLRCVDLRVEDWDPPI